MTLGELHVKDKNLVGDEVVLGMLLGYLGR